MRQLATKAKMKKFAALCVIGFAIYSYFQENQQPNSPDKATSTSTTDYSASNEALERAYKNQQSDLQIGGTGKVVKVLPDDLKGSRHQKFILKLASGRTLLVAHNIDLAPRIDSLREGDQVEFYGEYEWDARGGVMHWTHHDPRGRHADGWLRHNGKTYQ